jgi:hypothetical protein
VIAAISQWTGISEWTSSDMAWCTTVRAVSERSDSMLEMHGEGHGFIAVNFPHCEENPWDK